MSNDQQGNPFLLRTGVYLVFTVSGACGLIYQILWVRELSLVLGITTFAVCTVLSAFMAGLGIGSYFFGKIAVRSKRPLVLYGWLEIGIGICGLCLPFLFKGFMGFYSNFYEQLSTHPVMFILIRFLVIEALLLVPCTLMGGTISVLSKYFSRERSTISRDIGLLYALNTLGAVAGCTMAGFFFIPELGLTVATWVVVITNLCVGFLAFYLQRFSEAKPEDKADTATDTEAGAITGKAADKAHRTYSPSFLKIVLFVFAVSGFCSLGYEVLWTRTLVFYLHNSTYAFTTMLATFLLGISFGSILLNRWIDKTGRPSLLLAGAEVCIGLFSAFSLLLYPALPQLLKLFLSSFEMNSWGKSLLLQFSQSVVIILPATFMMGLTFPVVTRLYVTSLKTVSRSVGSIYSMNTFGCIFGSLVIGFVCLPLLGLMNSFLLLISLNLLLGFVVLVLSPEIKRLGKSAGAIAIVALFVLIHSFVPSDLFLRSFKRGHKIVFYRDGVTDSVMVKEAKGDSSTRVLCFTDGRGTAGTNTNAMNRFAGHLSVMFHPAPKNVLCICFGVGNTLSAIALHSEVKSVDCVELSENVINAAPYFPTNKNVLKNPKVKVIIQDGRNHLLGTAKKYDVIQLEPPEIHTDGVINLYTREFYELCMEKMTKNGVLSQWMNVAMMPLKEQKMMIRTFHEVFPHSTYWMLKQSLDQVLLIGTKEKLVINYSDFKARMEDDDLIFTDLEGKVGIKNPVDYLKNFMLSEEGIAGFVKGAQIVTDDRTRVDFTAPRSIDANYGLCNAFSGYRITCLKKEGLQATLDYYADKKLAMIEAAESAFPILTGFASEQQEEQVKADLDKALLDWKTRERRNAEKIRKRKEAFSNF